MKYYGALKSVRAPVNVITADRPFDAPFLIAPAYQLMDAALIAKLTAYVNGGGHLVLTCRTGQKDMNGHLWEAKWAEPIYRLIGAAIPSYDVLPPPVKGKVMYRGLPYEWGSWGDILEPNPGTSVIARYGDQFYARKAAAVTHSLGKGTVTYIGVDTPTGDLERRT
jgi:beta-galactosidase